ncbi:lipopolysaccharide heptosyltransferase I [Desulfonema ishimotonii]|uniref:lipopolysaccharide heptosyltransferase II n=2 Tax=Desulfonema ishimotonii TaxID=45657 RepID=A0A401G455_9BACT|nr:lipopolysaccharide heptosyltransferase I [Desulfonema ishimotonii]
MNILIVKLSAIGDVIHTLPALNALRRCYPDARITWVVESAAAGLVEGHEALDRVIISERKRWAKGLLRGPARLRNVSAACRFIREIRDTEYDLVIDFQQLLKSGVPVGLARGKCKAGFDRGMQHMEHSYLFLNRRIPPVSMEIHALRRYLILLEALGIPAPDVEYNLPVRRADEMAADALLAENGMAGSRLLVAINPVAQWETKLWENRKFAALADRLIAEYGADVVFTGGPDDGPVVADILSHMQHRASGFAGRTSLKVLAALCRKARFVISTDTGPMHLAAAVETPVVALFGPTAPWRTGPFGAGNRVIRTGLPCSPCFKRQCTRKDHMCMRGIRVRDVMAEIRRAGILPEE